MTAKAKAKVSISKEMSDIASRVIDSIDKATAREDVAAIVENEFIKQGHDLSSLGRELVSLQAGQSVKRQAKARSLSNVIREHQGEMFPDALAEAVMSIDSTVVKCKDANLKIMYSQEKAYIRNKISQDEAYVRTMKPFLQIKELMEDSGCSFTEACRILRSRQ